MSATPPCHPDESPPLRLAIVDDHMVVRDGIRAMAERTDTLTLVGEAGSREQALELAQRVAVDVALVDYRLGEESGFELCTLLKEAQPETLVVIFTGFGNSELLMQAIRAGASGYVLKETTTDRIPEILHAVVTDGSYFDHRLAGLALLTTLQGRDGGDSSHEGLTERETKILRLVAAGKSNVEIAQTLFLSPHTVKFCITKLLRRFDVRRRSELAKIASDIHL